MRESVPALHMLNLAVADMAASPEPGTAESVADAVGSGLGQQRGWRENCFRDPVIRT